MGRSVSNVGSGVDEGSSASGIIDSEVGGAEADILCTPACPSL